MVCSVTGTVTFRAPTGGRTTVPGMKLQFIGGGKMAEALLGGMLADGWATAAEIHVVEPSPERQTVLRDAHPGLSVGDTPIAPAVGRDQGRTGGRTGSASPA